jgi:outer membrane protein assembly factor BamB
VCAVVALLGAVWIGQAGVSQGATTADAGSQWTVYHGDMSGSGVSTSVTTVDTSAAAWTSPTLDGQLYGEPLVFGGDIYVATESNTVYALSSSTGAVVWSHHIADPVPASSLPCGDITPTVGITGTPVIDPSRSEIFVVADELVHGVPAHILVGLSTTAGTVEMTQNVDPPGAKPAALLQRTGLTLDAGRVLFAMGGNFGDCSTYRGRVGAVSETGGTPSFFTVDAAAGQSQGAIWMGGAAPAVDASGNVWVTVGNGSVTSAKQPYDGSDAALELSPSLQLLQYFAPTTWAQDNAADLDLSVEPTLLSNGQVVVSGKSRIIDLLDGTHLGGIGGEKASLASGCAQTIDGGSAVVGTTVYLPCLSGPIAVNVGASPPSLNVLWRAAAGGGPPVVAAGRVWTIGQDGTLYGLDPASGKVMQQASIGVPANHFPTPSVGDGLLLAPSANRVVAFRAATASSGTTTPSTTSGSATTTSTTATAAPAPTSRSRGGGGLSGGVIAAIVAAGVLLLGGTAWVILRRRTAKRA